MELESNFLKWEKKLQVPIFQGGLGVFHVNQPKLNFLNGIDNRLPIRTIINSSIVLPLGKKGTYLQTSIAYQQQSKFKSTIVGIIANIKLSESVATTSSFGKVNSWYAGLGVSIRSNDAFIVNLTLQKFHWKLAMAYDFNTSQYRATANSKNAFELILIYNISSYKMSSRF